MIYAGICIGGPKDGRRMSKSVPIWNVEDEMDLGPPLPLDTGAIIEGGNYTFTSYEFSPVYVDAATGGEVCAWIPKGQTKRETLAKLMEGYRP